MKATVTTRLPLHSSGVTLLAMMLFSLAGCVTGQRSLPIDGPVAVSGPAARVTVVRKKQFCGSAATHYVVTDERVLAALRPGQGVSFSVPPGDHVFGVYHHVIDDLVGIGGAGAGLPLGVSYGRYGVTVSVHYTAETEYNFLLTAKCVAWDENDRVEITQVVEWPDDLDIGSIEFGSQ